MMSAEALWSMMKDDAKPIGDRQLALMLEVDSMLQRGEFARCADVVELVIEQRGHAVYMDAVMGLSAVYGVERDDGLDDVRARLLAAVEEVER